MDSKNSIDDQLQDASSVLAAYHIAKFTGHAPGEVRLRFQQETLGHCGCTGNPLDQMRLLLRGCRDWFTKHQQDRLAASFAADESLISVEVAYLCARQVREAFLRETVTQERLLAVRRIGRIPMCPIPLVNGRLGACKDGRSH